MSAERDRRLSTQLQAIADRLEQLLREAAGGEERVSFVLLALPGTNMQYVANVARADGVAMIESLLARWRIEPRVPDLPEHQKEEMIARLLERCRGYHEALDGAMAVLATWSRPTEGMPPIEPFFPSKSPFWPAIEQGHKAMQEIEAQLAFARELEKGPIEAPDAKELH
jgi:hypothetical protein